MLQQVVGIDHFKGDTVPHNAFVLLAYHANELIATLARFELESI
jgi:hypothetical protein